MKKAPQKLFSRGQLYFASFLDEKLLLLIQSERNTGEQKASFLFARISLGPGDSFRARKESPKMTRIALDSGFGGRLTMDLDVDFAGSAASLSKGFCALPQEVCFSLTNCQVKCNKNSRKHSGENSNLGICGGENSKGIQNFSVENPRVKKYRIL